MPGFSSSSRVALSSGIAPLPWTKTNLASADEQPKPVSSCSQDLRERERGAPGLQRWLRAATEPAEAISLEKGSGIFVTPGCHPVRPGSSEVCWEGRAMLGLLLTLQFREETHGSNLAPLLSHQCYVPLERHKWPRQL